jgi:U3 small nucleolar ribonucleoprotein component
MNSIIKVPSNKDTVPSDCCDELLIEYIDSFNANIAHLRQDIREIVSEEVDKKLEWLIREFRESRKPKKYVEVGYR